GKKSWFMHSKKGIFRYLFCQECLNYQLIANASLGFKEPTTRFKESYVQETLPVQSEIEIAQILNVPLNKILKVAFFETPERKKPLALLIRGDLDFNYNKIRKEMRIKSILPMEHSLVRKISKNENGFLGPMGLYGFEVIADVSVKYMRNFICGLTNKDYLLCNANFGRDFPLFSFQNFHHARDEGPCPQCLKPQTLNPAEEVAEKLIISENSNNNWSHYLIHFDRIFQALFFQARDSGQFQLPESLRLFGGTVVCLDQTDKYMQTKVKELLDTLAKQNKNFLYDDRDISLKVKFLQASEYGLFPCLILKDEGEGIEVGVLKDPEVKVLNYSFDLFMNFLKKNKKIPGTIEDLPQQKLEAI
ncbi:YbaK/EbsC family protein, partial [Candidatus Riflebacteria bacterium]